MTEAIVSTPDIPATPPPAAPESAPAAAPQKAQTRMKHAIDAGQKNAEAKLAPSVLDVKTDEVKAPKELGDADLDALVAIKVNGEVKKVPLRQAIAIAQKAEASEKKMAEAAKIQQEAMRHKQALAQIEELLSKDPSEFLRKVGIDPEKFSEQMLEKKLKHMQMTPEQRDYEELKAYKAQQEKINAQREQEMEAQKVSMAELQYSQTLDNELTEAFAASELPKKRFYVQQVAAEMRGAALRGEDLTARRAVEIIKERYFDDLKDTFGDRDVGTILERLGPDNTKRIREYFVKLVQAPAPTTETKKSGPSSVERSPSKAPSITEKEWRQMRRKFF